MEPLQTFSFPSSYQKAVSLFGQAPADLRYCTLSLGYDQTYYALVNLRTRHNDKSIVAPSFLGPKCTIRIFNFLDATRIPGDYWSASIFCSALSYRSSGKGLEYWLVTFND